MADRIANADDGDCDARLAASVCARAKAAGWSLSKAEPVRSRWRFTWHPPHGPVMTCKSGRTPAEALAIACGKWLDWNSTPATTSPEEERIDLEKWFGSRRPQNAG